MSVISKSRSLHSNYEWISLSYQYQTGADIDNFADAKIAVKKQNSIDIVLYSVEQYYCHCLTVIHRIQCISILKLMQYSISILMLRSLQTNLQHIVLCEIGIGLFFASAMWYLYPALDNIWYKDINWAN